MRTLDFNETVELKYTRFSKLQLPASKSHSRYINRPIQSLSHSLLSRNGVLYLFTQVTNNFRFGELFLVPAQHVINVVPLA
jgi:hypothetical protein